LFLSIEREGKIEHCDRETTECNNGTITMKEGKHCVAKFSPAAPMVR
jgi:hypothetical protein